MTLLDCLDSKIVVVTAIISIATVVIVSIVVLNRPIIKEKDTSSYEIFCIENVKYVSIKGMLGPKIGLDGEIEHCELEEI